MDDEKILINTDYIKLGQLLKLASLVSQGSDAKTLIVNGYVSVNGENKPVGIRLYMLHRQIPKDKK